MARNESDVEDLMSEAVSLVRRIECRCPALDEPIVVGFNSLGWLFVYIGTDPMYRFDEVGRLRRAFVGRRLYRTNGSTLAEMERRRTDEINTPVANRESILLRRDLSLEELELFRLRMQKEILQVCQAFDAGTVTRQHPSDAAGIVDEVQRGLRRVLESPVFLAPAIVPR